jgi:hypothetical protein
MGAASAHRVEVKGRSLFRGLFTYRTRNPGRVQFLHAMVDM